MGVSTFLPCLLSFLVGEITAHRKHPTPSNQTSTCTVESQYLTTVKNPAQSLGHLVKWLTCMSITIVAQPSNRGETREGTVKSLDPSNDWKAALRHNTKLGNDEQVPRFLSLSKVPVQVSSMDVCSRLDKLHISRAFLLPLYYSDHLSAGHPGNYIMCYIITLSH